MFKNYFKIVLRNLLKQRTYSVINITGLTIGMACTILILLWVQDELNFDRFHENTDHLYRIIQVGNNQTQRGSGTPGRLSALVQEEIPEVKHIVRVTSSDRTLVRYGDKTFYEDAMIYTDPSFFDVFTFPLVKGDPKAALPDMQAVIITERIAKKYFGDEEPTGKVLNFDNQLDFHVTGVLKDIPANSHLQFDFILNNERLKKWWPNGYSWNEWNHWTYVVLHEQSQREEVSGKITDIVFKHVPTVTDLLSKMDLQPLSKIYLDTDIGGGQAGLGDIKYVYIFSVIAFFVLFIACINFMNLSTARSINRSKEVGMRKTFGAQRAQLAGQFYNESMLIAVFAAVFAVILVELFLPVFNNLAEKQLALNYLDPRLFLGLGAVTFLTGILSGSYPAIYLSSFNPISVLKTTHGKSSFRQKGSFRKILVVTQFTLSILLIICTTIIYQQLHFMQNKDLGFAKENVVYLPARGNIAWQYETMKTALLASPHIAGVSFKRNSPITRDWGGHPSWEGKDPAERIFMENTAVDYDYVDLMGLKIVNGRNFSREYTTDATDAILVNEEATRLMDFEDPLGQRVSFLKEGIIIGVLKDVHVASLKHKIRPQIFYLYSDIEADRMFLFGIVLIRIKAGETQNALTTLQNVWNQINPEYPFEFHFLSEEIDQQYLSERKISTILNYFTFLAILISCLGLFGLASYTAEQKTKEIGIRKVLGATVQGIVLLLSQSFAKWVLIANIIAWPIAWFAMSKWLQDFAYRIDIGLGTFLLAGALALIIALLTVSWQAIRAAMTNPVDALKYE